MVNRQFYIYKMDSSIFNENNYNYTISFRQAKKNGQIVSIGDSQILRSIRDITGRIYDKDKIELIFNRRNEFKKMPHSRKCASAVAELNRQIQNIMFIPEYLSLVIDKNSHYKKIIKNGLMLNGKKYRRFSCSASQARVNTVILISDDVYEELYKRIDNGRKKIPLNPSKENAYFGLASSATKVVSEPRVCVIDDCEETRKTFVNWVTTVDKPFEDDIIEQKWVDFEFNLFDGMGIIHPNFAKVWAEELGLDYVPAEFCIRHSFIKGMVCQFDFIDFCKLKNNENYMIKTLYGDMVDVRNYDLILTKSQFKMWNCYDSFEQYNENCHNNKLQWGVSQYAPKNTKDILTLNYQSLQTLKLSNEDISELCKQTTDLFSNITSDNIYYTILCMLGENINDETIDFFMQNSDNYWLKSLILDNDLIHDKYIYQKVYDNISTKIKNTYLGEIFVDGNYQCMVSDPYAFMEHACGLPVKGLLKQYQHYSNYWNEKGIDVVDAMRSPLTYRSEHNILNFIKNENTEYWYKHLDCGIIFNVHGDDVIRHADSDFDYDIVATTSNTVILNGIYTDSLPVAYEKGNTGKSMNTFEDLCNADMLAFGSKIGQITNKGSSIFAMLPLYDKDSEEYKELEKRLILIRVAQGNEIDRAKGVKTKEFPRHWTSYNFIHEDDSEELKHKKEVFNNIIIERKPYFFKNRYSKDKRAYNSYMEGRNIYCQVIFGCTIDELEQKENKTKKELAFIESVHKFCPLVDTDCEMNNLSKYMNKYEYELKRKLRNEHDEECYLKYLSGKTTIDKSIYSKIKSAVLRYFKYAKELSAVSYRYDKENTEDVFNDNYETLKEELYRICSNSKTLTDYMVILFYTDIKSKNKNILWKICGKYMYMNISHKCEQYTVPMITYKNDYMFEYMGKKFIVKKIRKENL